MKKKDFKTGFDSLLTNSNDKTKITITEEVRATFIVNSDHLEKLKAVSYWQRKKIKNIVDEAFQHYIDSYEKKNGVIQLRK